MFWGLFDFNDRALFLGFCLKLERPTPRSAPPLERMGIDKSAREFQREFGLSETLNRFSRRFARAFEFELLPFPSCCVVMEDNLISQCLFTSTSI